MEKLAIKEQNKTNTQKLDSDLSTLILTTKSVLTTTTTLNNHLIDLHTKLSITSKILTDLNKLADIIKNVQKLLKAISVIPQLRKEAQVALDALKLISPSVKSAQSILKPIDNKIKPLRDKVNDFESNVAKFKDKIDDLKNKLINLRGQFERAENCINDLPDGKVKTNLLLTLENLAGEVDIPVTTINNNIASIETTFKTVVSTIKNKVDAQLEQLEHIEQGINALESALNLLLEPLHELGGLLSKRFTITFPYPCLKSGICDYKLPISGELIVNGANKIEKYIEKQLTGVLLKAAQVFGIKKLVQKVLYDFNHAFDIIARKLNLKIKIDLPGIDKLNDAAAETQKAAVELTNQFKLDMSALNNGLTKIETAYKKSQKIYTDCTCCP